MKPDIEATTRRAVLVLGMHRSGTSALAGALIKLGATPPRTLMGAAAANPRGHWESWAVCEFHDRLLDAAGTSWDGWTRIRSEWLESTDAKPFVEEFPGLLRQEFGDASKFVVKDPRICRFVPFWLRCLEAESVAASSIIILRNPFEVARSLELRDGLPPTYSLLMWLRHVLDAEVDTRGMSRSIVQYGDLLRDWKAVIDEIAIDTGVQWTSAKSNLDSDIAEFLNSEFRDHSIAGGSTSGSPMSHWIEETCRAFELLRERNRSPTDALRVLDDVRSEFNQLTEVFEPVATHARTERREAASRQLLAAERERALADNVERLGGEIERAHLRIEEFSRERDRVLEELGRSRARVDDLLSSGSWRITAPLRGIMRVLMRMGLRVFLM